MMIVQKEKIFSLQAATFYVKVDSSFFVLFRRMLQQIPIVKISSDLCESINKL